MQAFELELLKKAMEASGDAIGIFDRQGKFVYYNTALKELACEEAFFEKARGGTFERDPSIKNNFFSTLATTGTWQQEIEIQCKKDQKKHYYILTANAIKNTDDEIIGYVGIHKDITEIKALHAELDTMNTELEKALIEATHELTEANESLKQQIEESKILTVQLEQMNELLKENSKMFMHGPVVVFKWINKPGRPIEYVSPNVEKILGYDLATLRMGKKFEELIHPNDIEKLKTDSIMHQNNSQTDASQKFYRIMKGSGEMARVMDYTTYLREGDGSIKSMIGYLIDLSAQDCFDTQLQTLVEESGE